MSAVKNVGFAKSAASLRSASRWLATALTNCMCAEHLNLTNRMSETATRPRGWQRAGAISFPIKPVPRFHKKEWRRNQSVKRLLGFFCSEIEEIIREEQLHHSLTEVGGYLHINIHVYRVFCT
ncbi:hypothetical protein WA026_003977 [Henosepilachna vigintioctopunctata]|uniref:Uncharacterized protein n=1 Tax=Henosepilachna vigintioctopunctata TaxID=420089 RepID=A0AAW1U603_9CUCU